MEVGHEWESWKKDRKQDIKLTVLEHQNIS